MTGAAGERRIAAEEGALRRLARELHDDFGPRVAALGLEIEALRRRIGEEDPLRVDLRAIGERLAGLAEDLRRAGHDLHPAALERRGLVAALRDHAAEVERRSGIPVGLELAAELAPFDSLPPPLALGIYRIAQEAIANAARHAAARTIRLRLAASSDEVRLAVIDDGRGFDSATAGEAGGLGLAILAERAEAAGGTLRLTSAPGRGTEVEVQVPLR